MASTSEFNLDVPDSYEQFKKAALQPAKRRISLGMGDLCLSMISDELPSEMVDCADEILTELCGGDDLNQSLDLDTLSRLEKELARDTDHVNGEQSAAEANKEIIARPQNEPQARNTSDVADVTARPTMLDFENWQPINCAEGVEQLNSFLGQAHYRRKFVKVLRNIVKEPIVNRKHPLTQMMSSIIHPRQMKAYAYSRTYTGKLPLNKYEALLDVCEEVMRETNPDYDHAQFHNELKVKVLKNAEYRYKRNC